MLGLSERRARQAILCETQFEFALWAKQRPPL